MATEPKNIISLGDPEYDAIYAIYLHQRAKQFSFAGATWRANKDDLVVKFVRIASDGVDGAYASSSMPLNG